MRWTKRRFFSGWALGAVCLAVVAALLLARGSWLDALPRLLRRQS